MLLLHQFSKTTATDRGLQETDSPPISSGPLEGTHNKIKTLKRQDGGYRDTGFFKLGIMGIHEAKYALAG